MAYPRPASKTRLSARGHEVITTSYASTSTGTARRSTYRAENIQWRTHSNLTALLLAPRHNSAGNKRRHTDAEEQATCNRSEVPASPAAAAMAATGPLGDLKLPVYRDIKF
ncbi:hypothetical protein OEZ85_006423 [Tetradesmus obliquus]|uniref:Uncharacterized protein n=1 Tax=Tetradesmus obliquus TaxID=3088 RepID=A0ABY8TUV6_TETOB|nr:hypothetical protein OEZ85_006423 [Tetradesmus obliquus]